MSKASDAAYKRQPTTFVCNGSLLSARYHAPSRHSQGNGNWYFPFWSSQSSVKRFPNGGGFPRLKSASKRSFLDSAKNRAIAMAIIKSLYCRPGQADVPRDKSVYADPRWRELTMPWRPQRHPGRELALLVLIMAISIGGGLIGWRLVRYVGESLQGPTDISSQSRSSPTR